MKVQALGLPVVVAPLLLYSDDTSGNRSKKWNKFDCWCFMLAGLPRHLNAQLPNIHFIACSNEVCIASIERSQCMFVTPTFILHPQVAVLEMARPIVEELLMLEKGVQMFDAYLGKDVLIVAPVLAVLGDNPRHAHQPFGEWSKQVLPDVHGESELYMTRRMHGIVGMATTSPPTRKEL